MDSVNDACHFGWKIVGFNSICRPVPGAWRPSGPRITDRRGPRADLLDHDLQGLNFSTIQQTGDRTRPGPKARRINPQLQAFQPLTTTDTVLTPEKTTIMRSSSETSITTAIVAVSHPVNPDSSAASAIVPYEGQKINVDEDSYVFGLRIRVFVTIWQTNSVI